MAVSVDFVRNRRAICALAVLIPIAVVPVNWSSAFAVSAASAPASSCTLSVDAATVHPGDKLTLAGSGFLPDQIVAITPAGGSVGEVTTNPHGAFSYDIYLPTTVTGASFRVVATSSGANCSVNPKVTVTTAPQLSKGELAFTGLPAIAASIGGVFLLACGLLFVTIGRRRKA